MSLALEIHDINNEITRECGIIFLNIKKNFIFHCTICKKNFRGFGKYRDHIRNHHYHNLKNDSEEELEASTEKELNLKALEDIKISNSLDKYTTELIIQKNTFELVDQPNSQIQTNFSEEHKNCHLSEPNYQHNARVPANVLQEDEVDIQILKQAKNIEVRKSTDGNRNPIPKKRKCQEEKEASICPICKETLSKNTHLKTHLKRHTNEKNYKCSVCAKAFFTRCELDTHVRTHTGSRPYLCTTCGEAFTTASKLNAHVNQKHIRQRNKQCPICNMSFYSSVLLKNHMIIHSDERPFECEMCDSKFKRRKGLLSHMKMHDNKKEYVCDMCPARFNQKCNLNSHRKNKHAIASTNKEVG